MCTINPKEGQLEEEKCSEEFQNFFQFLNFGYDYLNNLFYFISKIKGAARQRYGVNEPLQSLQTVVRGERQGRAFSSHGLPHKFAFLWVGDML